MESIGLTRRRRQLELLARACERGEPAQIRPRDTDTAAGPENAALLALEDDGVLLYWPEITEADVTAAGTELDVSFNVDGRNFRFRSPSQGRVQRRLNARGSVSALKVSLPLRIDPAQRRRTPRFTLRPHDLPAAALTPVVDHDQRIALRIVELAALHLRAEAAPALRELFIVGTHHWLELALPGETAAIEWIVRLTHVGERESDAVPGSVLLSFTVCAGDDGTRTMDALDRIEKYLAREGRPGNGAPAPGTELEGARC